MHECRWRFDSFIWLAGLLPYEIDVVIAKSPTFVQKEPIHGYGNDRG
jgi:hypothetical protein